jgi:hypothetical protein
LGAIETQGVKGEVIKLRECKKNVVEILIFDPPVIGYGKANMLKNPR